MQNLFDQPIRSGKVRKGVRYYQYGNGTINIMGQKYLGYSIRDAIALYRKKFPAY